MPPARSRPNPVLVILTLAVCALWPAVPAVAQDDEDAVVADRVIERYKRILRTNPRELGAFDRLYDLYSERSSVQALLDEYTALTQAEPDEPSHWVILGHITKRRGDRDRAEAAYLKAIALAPDDAYPRQMLGGVYVRRREWAKAATAYTESIERQPPLDDRIAILKALGRCYSELGERERAIETWNTIVELDPKGVFTRLDLAELYRDLRLLDEAITQYEGITAIESNDPYWVCRAKIEIGKIDDELDRTAEALEAFEQALALTASDSWLREEIVTLIAELFHSRNDLDGLAGYYRAKLEKNPKDVEAIAQLAGALGAMGRDDEAVAQYLQGLEHAPSSVPLRTALIELLVDVGRYDDAVPHARRLVKAHPKTIEHHRVLGEILVRAGRLDEAKQALRGVLTGGSSDPNRHMALAELYARFDFVDEAIAAHEAAIRLAPDNADYVIALGQYYASLFRYKQALAAFRRIVEGEGRATAANTSRLAEVLDHHGFAEEAVEAAERAVELAPDSFELADRYARLLAKYDRTDDALAVLEALLAKAPNEFFRVDVEDRIFSILRRQGKLQERIEAAEAALKSDPGVDKLLRLARMYAKTADTAKERTCLERARTTAPDNVDVLRRLARLVQRQGGTADAIKINEQLIELDATNAREYLETITALYLSKGQEQQARETAQRIIARRPKEPSGYALLARVEARFQHTDEAIDALRQAIARRPKSPDLHSALSRLYERAGRIDEAIEELWRCWELEESGLGRLTYVHALGALYESQDRLDELKEHLRALTRQTRRDPFARLALAEVERSSGDLEAAKRELSRLHTRRPKNTDTLVQLVAVCHELDELDEAIRYQERLTQLDPSQSNRRTLGVLFYDAGRDAEAIEAWSKLTKERATDPQSYIELAKLLLRYNLQDAALDALTKADRLEPNEWRTLYEIAELYEAVAQWTMAAAVYERLLELPDEEPADTKAPSQVRARVYSRSMRVSSSISKPGTGSDLLDRLRMLEQVAQLLSSQRYRGATVWTPTNLAEAKMAAYVKLVYTHEIAGTLDRFERTHAALPAEGSPDIGTLTARIEFLYVLGQTDECLELLDAVIALAPDEVALRIASAHLASRLGDVDRLETAYRFLIEKEHNQATRYLEALIRVLAQRHDEEKLGQYVDEIVASAKAKKMPFATAVNLTIAAGTADRTRELIEAMLADKDAHPSNLYSVATALLSSQDFDLGSDLIAEIEKRVSEADSSGMSFANLYQRAYQAAQNAGRVDTACQYALRYLEHSTPKREQTPPPKPGTNAWSSTCSALNSRLRHHSTAYNPSSGNRHPYLNSTRVLSSERIRALVLAVESSRALGDDGRVRQALEQWAEAAEGPAKIDPLVALNYVAFLHGDPEQAAAYIDKALEIDAHNQNLLVFKLHLLWLQGEYAAALSRFEQRAEHDGQLPQEVVTTIHTAATAVGLDEVADRMTRKLLETELPFNALCSMADQMLKRGKRAAALDLVAKAAEAAGRAGAAGSDINQLQRVAGLFVKLGDQDRAVELAARILKQSQGTGVQPYTSSRQSSQLANTVTGALSILHDAGRNDEVTGFLKRAERSARTASELYALADVHRKLGDTAGQMALLERIAKLGRGDANILASTAQRLWNSGLINETVDLYKTMLVRSPGAIENCRYDLVRCFFESGRQAELIEIALKTSRRFASRSSSYSGFGGPPSRSTSFLEQIANECANRNMTREAIALYERAMQVSPAPDSSVCSRLAQLYMTVGEPEKAAALLEGQVLGHPSAGVGRIGLLRVSSNQPSQGTIHNLVKAHRRLGTLDELIERVEHDVEARPQDGALRHVLFELYVQNGRGAEARAVAESVIRSAPAGLGSGNAIRFVSRLSGFGFHEDAVAICDPLLEQCRAEGRTDFDLLTCAASAYARMGNIEKARALSMEIVENAPPAQQNAHAYDRAQFLERYGALDDALAVYQQLARSGRRDDYQARNAQRAALKLALRLGRLDEVLAAVPDEIAPIDEARYSMMASWLYEMRCYREAARVHKRLLGSNPHNAHARQQLVSCLESMGDRQQAAEQLAVLVGRFPAETDHLVRLARLHGRMELYDQQESVLKTLVERDPNAGSYGRLASFYETRKQHEKLIEVRLKLVELQPGSAPARTGLGNAYLAAGDTEKAVEVWREIPTIDPSAKGWLALAEALHRASLPGEAIAACDEAAALNPRDRSTLRSLGNAYKAAGERDKAADVWRIVPTVLNTSASWVELGHALNGLGKKKEAVAAYETALQLQPADYSALQALVNGLKANDDHEKALDVACRAIEHGWYARDYRSTVQVALRVVSSVRDKERAAALRSRLIATLTGMDSVSKAFRASALVEVAASWPSSDQEGKVRVLHKALELDESDPRVVQHLATALARAGRRDEAIELHRRLAERDPWERSSAVSLVNELAKANRNDEARQELDRLAEKAVTTDQLNSVAAMYAGSLNDPARAIELYERAAKRDPTNVSIARSLAEFLIKQDRTDDALAVLDRTAQVSPNADTYRVFAGLLARNEVKAEAEHYYRLAMQAQPRRSSPVIDLGRFLEKDGRHDEALAVYEKAREEFSAEGDCDRFDEEIKKLKGSAGLRLDPLRDAA